MNFPDTAFFQFFHWVVNTPGLGSVGVAIVATTAISFAGSALLWIVRGGKADEREVYTYPTPALHDHH